MEGAYGCCTRSTSPRELGAQCDSCPLSERVPVPIEPASLTQEVFLLGESPGASEEASHRPFVGESGILLNDLLSWLEVPRAACHISNTILCRPLKHQTGKQWAAAETCCAPRLARELPTIPDGSLVIAMGNHAIKALTGHAQVLAWRGYPLHSPGLSERGITVYPTVHPAFVLRSPSYLPVIKEDFKRAFDWKAGRLKPWVWPRIIIDEGPAMVDALEHLVHQPFVGVDVETGGDNPFVDPLLCIGLASPDLAVSAPWPAQDPNVDALVRLILARRAVGKVFQNGNYDKISLKAWGVDYATDDEFDTLIAHRIVAPLLRHDLGFIASMELGGPRWKTLFKVMDDRKGGERFRKAKEDPAKWRDMLDYNAKDALMTARLRQPLYARLRDG